MNIDIVGGAHHRRISSLSAEGFAYSSSEDEMMIHDDMTTLPEDQEIPHANSMLSILASSSPEIRQLCKTAKLVPMENNELFDTQHYQQQESPQAANQDLQDWGFGARPTQRVSYQHQSPSPLNVVDAPPPPTRRPPLQPPYELNRSKSAPIHHETSSTISPRSVKRISLSPSTIGDCHHILDDLSLNLRQQCSLQLHQAKLDTVPPRPSMHRRRSYDALPSVQEILSPPSPQQLRQPPPPEDAQRQHSVHFAQLPTPTRRNSHRRNTNVLL